MFEKDKVYLLPVEVVEDGNPDMPPVDEDRGVAYIRLTVVENNIDGSNSGLEGTPMDRTGWSVTVSSVYGSGVGDQMLDGNAATAWTSNSDQTHEVVLDMGASRQVKGFLITPNYVYRSENITKMNVYSSLNGTDWKLEGLYNGTAPSGSAANPDIKTIRFYRAVNARFFRFEILESNGQSYTGIGELNGVE